MNARWLLVAALAAGPLPSDLQAQSSPLLQLQGQPYSNGAMTLHLIGTPGQATLLLFGLDPLDPPAQTTKGAFYIGTVFNAFSLGAIPALGRIDMPVAVPPLDPVLAGIPIVMQALVPGALSNPATLPLDQPYYVPAELVMLASPSPTALGLFSDRFATGDLNGDGYPDVAVAAGKEHASGVSESGRVYVFWGPDLASLTSLQSPSPSIKGFFGVGLVVSDFDNDGVDDLLVTEGTGTPAVSPHGRAHVFSGGEPFAVSPALSIDSLGSGGAYTQYGHFMVAADLNADGFRDFAVGVERAVVQGFANAGLIEVHWGPDFSQGGLLFAPVIETNGFFGERLGLGDINGDDVADIIVGNPRKAVGGTPSMGQVHLLQAPSLGLVKTLSHPLPSGLNSRFGNAVVGEDLDGDGMADVIATDQRNHAFVFWSPDFSKYTVITRPPDPVGGTGISISFGYFAATGDVNGDGLADVLVAEPYFQRVFAAMGPYWSIFHVVLDGLQGAISDFGWGLQSRDIDLDGKAELLVGNDFGDVGGIGAGRLAVFDLN